jgi:glycosyltransferase involved in cell wall biosynthesis
MKIAVATGARDEAANCASWAENMSEADAIYVLDDQSTDGTPDILRSLGVNVVEGGVRPFRFDRMRNRVLDAVPDDFDIVVSADLDERFCEGWRALVEKYWTPETTHGRYSYHWDENNLLIYYKINARRGLRWKGAAHEKPYYDRPEVHTLIPGLVLYQHHDAGKSRQFALELDKINVAENPGDAQCQYFLARDSFVFAGPEESIREFRKFLGMAGPAPENRMRAWLYIAVAEERRGNGAAALEAYHSAVKEFPLPQWVRQGRAGLIISMTI